LLFPKYDARALFACGEICGVERHEVADVESVKRKSVCGGVCQLFRVGGVLQTGSVCYFDFISAQKQCRD